MLTSAAKRKRPGREGPPSAPLVCRIRFGPQLILRGSALGLEQKESGLCPQWVKVADIAISPPDVRSPHHPLCKFRIDKDVERSDFAIASNDDIQSGVVW